MAKYLVHDEFDVSDHCFVHMDINRAVNGKKLPQ